MRGHLNNEGPHWSILGAPLYIWNIGARKQHCKAVLLGCLLCHYLKLARAYFQQTQTHRKRLIHASRRLSTCQPYPPEADFVRLKLFEIQAMDWMFLIAAFTNFCLHVKIGSRLKMIAKADFQVMSRYLTSEPAQKSFYLPTHADKEIIHLKPRPSYFFGQNQTTDWGSRRKFNSMDSVDAHMTNGPDCSVVSGQNIDTLKQILEQSLRDINATLAKGVHEIKAELSDQVQTILISIPRQPAQSNNPVSIEADIYD